MDRNRTDRLYEALKLIEGEKFDVAIRALQNEISPFSESDSHNGEGLAKRSNSFLNGAIKTLQEISEFEPPIVNMLNAEGQKRWSEFRREVGKRKLLSIKCVRTVIETEGGRRFLEGKHGGLMLEGFPDDNGMERRLFDRMSELEKAMLSREIRQHEAMAEFMEAMTMRDDSAPGDTAKPPKEPSADDGAAKRQRDPKVKMPIEWRGDQDKLAELADELQTRGYIKRSQWFVERFGSDCPPDVDGWEGQSNHIVYLLEQLQGKKLFVHVPQSRLERVFRIKGYKSKKDGYGRNGAGKPTKVDEIDRILSCVFSDSKPA